MDEEIVVLVNEKNEVLGTAPKLATHTADTPLHRGFSVFLFNSRGELLLQRRSKKKKTWPSVWSNSCCGHPMMDEASIIAAKRRLKDELGLTIQNIFEVLPHFRYRAEKDGIVENELCPVMVAFSDQLPIPNTDEVAEISWIPWTEFLHIIRDTPGTYSQWAEEEGKQLLENPLFLSLWKEFVHQT